MEINLSGNIYIYFIRSVFEGNKKTGIELIIDVKKSDILLIDGLNRLKKINKNKIYIKNDNIQSKIKIYEKHYTCNITFKFINDILSSSDIILMDIKNINYDKKKVIDNRLYLQKYSTNKNNTVKQIMDLL